MTSTQKNVILCKMKHKTQVRCSISVYLCDYTQTRVMSHFFFSIALASFHIFVTFESRGIKTLRLKVPF